MTDRPAGPEPRREKLDPEAMVLRVKQSPVTRFRRGAIIAIAATGSASLAGVAWLALKPAHHITAIPDDEREIRTSASPDALADAPRSYGDAPRLGPPLPGDLGRPILKRQRQIGTAPDVTSDSAQRAAAEAETERQRLLAERRAARQSGLLVQLAGTSPKRPTAPPGASYELAESQPAERPTEQSPPPRVAGSASDSDVSPHQIVPPASPWTLHAGSIIAASLITGLNSDIPGLVTAQITENVHDSVTGRTLLIPQGARLIGRYDTDIAYGQSRALVVWQRILFPDGSSVRIDDVPGTDVQGHAGLADRVNRHGWQLLKGVALSTLLGVGTELSFGSTESDLVRAIRESAQEGGSRAGDQLVAKGLDIRPTLRVRPGWLLRVVVHKDIVLKPWMAK